MISLIDGSGSVTIESTSEGSRSISVEPVNGSFVPYTKCLTEYPLELIQLIFELKGANYLCDEILREIDPNYVRRDLFEDLNAYFPADFFFGKRILDFGCGSGASSMILARSFPESQIVGVELSESHLRIARARNKYYGYSNIEFHVSPSGNELPLEIGEFDLVIMSAVYEHLLPVERQVAMPLVWKHIKQGGHLFLNMTPHRWFPVEHHTTGLPLINYFPDRLAHFCANRFSKRITKSGESWETLLRKGIRGGTETEIFSILSIENSSPVLLEPIGKGMTDRIDLWFSQLNQEKRIALKKLIKFALKSIHKTSGVTLVPNLSLVFRKE